MFAEILKMNCAQRRNMIIVAIILRNPTSRSFKFCCMDFFYYYYGALYKLLLLIKQSKIFNFDVVKEQSYVQLSKMMQVSV